MRVTENKRRDTKSKSPSDMFLFPTFNICIFYKIIGWIICWTKIRATIIKKIRLNPKKKIVLEELEGRLNDTRCKDIDYDNTCHEKSSSKSCIIHDWFFLNSKDDRPYKRGNEDEDDWLKDHQKQFDKEDILIISFYERNKAIYG